MDDARIDNVGSGAQQKYRRERLGYLFQNYALVENQSVTFNMRIALGPGHLSRANKHMIAESLTKVGLAGYEKRPVHQLSGGEQQRVALARLMAKKADVILADEPTGALDDSNSAMVIDTLRGFADAGATVLIATHDHTVMDACDTRLVLDRRA